MTVKKTVAVRKPRRISSKVRLKNAIEADDNLEILKSQRMMVYDDLILCDELKDRIISQQTLMSINKEIIKIEGSREEMPEHVENDLSDDYSLRNNPYGGE